MKILITGSTGFLGSHIKALLDKEYQVTGASHTWSDENTIKVDLAESKCIPILLADQWDVIVHCAAVLPESLEGESALRTSRINSLIDKHVIKIWKESKAHLIFLSGTSVYGENSDNLVLHENAKLNPIGPYVNQKINAENEIVSHDNLLKTVLRISAPYGVGQWTQTVLQMFVQQALEGKPLYYYGTGSRTQDFTAARDVAEAVKKSIEHRVTGIFNIASGNPISMKELAELVASLVSQKVKVLPSGKEDTQEKYRANFSIEQAKNELKWYPETSLEKGLLMLIHEKKLK